MWTTNSTLQLIEDLQMWRCLWDVCSEVYKDRGKKAEAVAELAGEYEVTKEEMEKKLHTLKCQFRREHKKLIDEKKSGASPKKSTWFGYERMLFLLPSRGSSSTDVDSIPSVLPPTTTDEKEEESTENQPETPTFQQPKRKKMCNPPYDVSLEALKCMKLLTEVVTKRDSETIFGEFISDSLRTSNRPQSEVNEAKQRMTQIIFDLQNGVLAQISYSSNSTPSQSSASVLSQDESSNIATLSSYLSVFT